MAYVETQEPKLISETDLHGKTYAHPAFGQISVVRRSGGRSYLYGSDFGHHATIGITISHSELNRSISREWSFAREQIIEIEMSEAQWATFVSSVGVGEGSQCTIRHVNRERTPYLPAPEAAHETFNRELEAHLRDDIAKLREQCDEIEALNLPKGKTQALRHVLFKMIQNLEANLPYLVSTFSEQTEKTVEKAKMEVHGYMTGVISRAGLNALTADQLPLALDAPKAKVDD